MKVKIYLNDGEDHFFGFENKFANNPELTMVHSFEIPFERQRMNAFEVEKWMKTNLEIIFYQLNAGPGSERLEEWAVEYFGKFLRSLSVGDVVVVGETAWSCESAGWRIITTDQLNRAIIWDDELNGVPR